MRTVAPTAGRADFGGVRVHADERAAESARALGADAYTFGPHIVFGQGGFAPHSSAGRELLAHELSHVVQQSTGQRRIQGSWRLDRTVVDDRRETSITDENGDVSSWGGGVGVVYGRARAWQETGWVHQKVGGSAQVAHWTRTRYIFKNEAPFGDYLQLRPEGSIAGRAKSEDLTFARASSVVWGRIIERTSENPNPGDRELFSPLKDGGVSAATIGDLAEVEADVSLGEHGNVNVRIPLKKVNEGVPSPYEGAISPIHEVRSNADEVHVILGGRVTADADIRTAIISWDVAPWVSRNWNIGGGTATYRMYWDSVSPPPPRPAAPTIQGGGGAAADDGGGVLTPSGTFVVSKRGHPLEGQTVTYGDPRNKHTKNAQARANFLKSVAGDDPNRYRGALKRWVAASRDSNKSYGSQFGAEGIPRYEEFVRRAVEDGKVKAGKYRIDVGVNYGVDVVKPWPLTSGVRVDGVPHGAHIIPEE